MNLISQLNFAVFQLLKFDIQFSKNHNTYVFNNKWVNEIEGKFYAEQVKNIKRLLQKQFRNGLNHEEYLQNLLEPIWERVYFLAANMVHSPEFIHLYSKNIDPLRSHKKSPISNADLFDQYQQSLNDNSTRKSDLYSFLDFNSTNLNDYKTPLEFENSLLLYAIDNYSKAINDLHLDIYLLHSNAKYIDFKNLNFETSIQKQEKDEFCHFNLDKKSIAHLFRFLLEEKIILLDEKNESKNELEMKRFVEANFTYKNTSNERVPIKTFTREYSEVRSGSSPEVKKHKQFIDNLIDKLQHRKDRLKD